MSVMSEEKEPKEQEAAPPAAGHWDTPDAEQLLSLVAPDMARRCCVYTVSVYSFAVDHTSGICHVTDVKSGRWSITSKNKCLLLCHILF